MRRYRASVLLLSARGGCLCQVLRHRLPATAVARRLAAEPTPGASAEHRRASPDCAA